MVRRRNSLRVLNRLKYSYLRGTVAWRLLHCSYLSVEACAWKVEAETVVLQCSPYFFDKRF